MIELVPLTRQFQSIKEQLLQEISHTLDSGAYILGPKVKHFEEKIAERIGVPHAIGVANGTDALVLTLDAYGIGPGDEVITTPFTFFATAEAISRVGAVPVFADIDPQTYNINPSEIEKRITPATKAIIPVHLFGQPAHMDEIMAIAAKHGLWVIEDACQAFGATYKGKQAGSLGHAACFSFFPTKNLGTLGDGGLIATADDQLAQRIRQLRHHGSKQKYVHERLGYNSRLDEVHAAILLVCLNKIDAWNEQRRRLAGRYRMGLANHPQLYIAPEAEDRTHSYHLFCIQSEVRDELQKQLTKRHIQSVVYYPIPLHLQEVYHHLNYTPGDFPIAEAMAQQVLALPIGPYLSDQEQDDVIKAILNILEGCDVQ